MLKKQKQSRLIKEEPQPIKKIGKNGTDRLFFWQRNCNLILKAVK
jgi:hypothetical protein